MQKEVGGRSADDDSESAKTPQFRSSVSMREIKDREVMLLCVDGHVCAR